jgi:hypothetical protein
MRLPSFLASVFGGRKKPGLAKLARLASLAPTYDDKEREDEAHAIVAALRATPLDKRVKRALDARLPESATKLLTYAGVVLGELIDDDLLRLAMGHRALLTWLDVDREECVQFCIARAHRLTALQLWQLMIELEDASEIYDVFAPIYRGASAADARALLAVPFDDATARRVFADARIVDVALEMLVTDVRASCTLLGMNASPRAVEELRAILERVPADDDPWSATEEGALAAIDGLANALPAQAFIDVLAEFLASQPKRLVPHMYLSMRIAQYAIALDQHPLIRDNTSLRWAIAQAVMPPPMPVG